LKATYKNSYSVKENEVLWELHEICHELHGELKRKPLDEINRDARETFNRWQQQRLPQRPEFVGGKMPK
jgi:hypothetical protein